MSATRPFLPDPQRLPPGTRLPLPTRAEVRALVAEQTAAKRAVMARGENPDHLGLDHVDAVERYAAALARQDGDAAGALFLRLWTEELDAATAQIAYEAATDAAPTPSAVGAHAANLRAAGWLAVLLAGALLVSLFAGS